MVILVFCSFVLLVVAFVSFVTVSADAVINFPVIFELFYIISCCCDCVVVVIVLLLLLL